MGFYIVNSSGEKIYPDKWDTEHDAEIAIRILGLDGASVSKWTHFLDEDHVAVFMSRIEIDADGCWNWTGTLRGGYSVFNHKNIKYRTAAGHRWSYEHFKGAIPEGLTIDHLCCNTRCVNPDHLEAVTQSENSRRRSKAWRASKP